MLSIDGGDTSMAYIEMVHSSKRYQMGSTAIVANDDVY
nr:MAG TPA: hypothetical protein [Caudoviricetes sp.]